MPFVEARKPMKCLSIYLFLLFFTLQTPSLADDISDFQIEGMSIGDSLLDFLSEDEINNSRRNYFSNRKYYAVGISKNIEIYETIDIYLKSGDKSYEIKTIAGYIFINKKKCLAKRKQVTKELRDLFKNSKEVNSENDSHAADKTGKSKVYTTSFLLKNKEADDHIRVECTDWSKDIEDKHNWGDNFNVSAVTKEINDWYISGYQ